MKVLAEKKGRQYFITLFGMEYEVIFPIEKEEVKKTTKRANKK